MVIGMKNFLSTLILIIIYLSLNTEQTKTVFDVKEDSDIYDFYHIKMDYLYTNNFNELFNDIDIIYLKAYVNPIYDKKIDNIFFYKDIENFRKSYTQRLKDRGYYIEANKYLIKPIKIDSVLVYSSLNNIYDKIDFKNKKHEIMKDNEYLDQNSS